MNSTGDDGAGNELSLGTISGIVGSGIVIIIIGGGMSMLVIFLFIKKEKTKSVGTTTKHNTEWSRCILSRYKLNIPRCEKIHCSR